jgi:hypothetical protein
MKYHEGRKVPSVTTVLNSQLPKHPGIYGWEQKLRRAGINPRDELERLSRVGTIVHFKILAGISPVKLDAPGFPFNQYPEKIDTYTEIAQELWDELDLPITNPICEHTFIDTQHLYCGTFDLLCDIDGVRTLIDIKTSAVPRDNHLIQVAAYGRYAGAEEGMVVSLCPFIEKNPDMVAHAVKLNAHEMRIKSDHFLRMTAAWHEKHNKRPNN